MNSTYASVITMGWAVSGRRQGQASRVAQNRPPAVTRPAATYWLARERGDINPFVSG